MSLANSTYTNAKGVVVTAMDPVEDGDSESASDTEDGEESDEEYEQAIDNSTDDTSPQHIVCINNETLKIRDESMEKVLFTLNKNTPVVKFQGWDVHKKTKVIDGISYKFVKIQALGREDGIENKGWAPEQFIKFRSQCEQYLKDRDHSDKQDNHKKEDDDEQDDRDLNRSAKGTRYGLSKKCCRFPLMENTRNRYSKGKAAFGARRSKGKRKHAGNDLYLRKNAPIVAVKDGKVLRDLYKFYQGTFAMEVKHQGGFVVRYGEVRGKHQKKVYENARIKQGQKIATMGKTRCCTPMLHFELYEGTKKGPLNKKGNKFQRRKDLISPLEYLQAWDKRS